MSGEEEEPVVELVTFSSKKGSYVYVPLPPGTATGHRAELWNVDNWAREVQIQTLSQGDNLFARLLDQETGAVFAECPLPCDGTPLTTAVEPVIDSSRYFVLRLVDPVTKNHAFIGIGFRERGESSNFCAALDEYRQYLRRKREAEALRLSYEQRASSIEDGELGLESHKGTLKGEPPGNLELKEPIRLNIGGIIKPPRGDDPTSGSTEEGNRTKLATSAVKIVGDKLMLSPPPSAGSALQASCPASAGLAGPVGVGELERRTPQAPLSGSFTQLASVDADGVDDDEWGNFVG